MESSPEGNQGSETGEHALEFVHVDGFWAAHGVCITHLDIVDVECQCHLCLVVWFRRHHWTACESFLLRNVQSQMRVAEECVRKISIFVLLLLWCFVLLGDGGRLNLNGGLRRWTLQAHTSRAYCCSCLGEASLVSFEGWTWCSIWS